MKAVDTNILVYSHREESPWHEPAARRLKELAEGLEPWAIAWPCIHEFVGIVTHPKIFAPPTPLTTALAEIKDWMESPTLVLIGEMPGYFAEFEKVVLEGQVVGPKVHDARIAAICIQHGVDVLWTADRDLSRFPSLKVQNPLVN